MTNAISRTWLLMAMLCVTAGAAMAHPALQTPHRSAPLPSASILVDSEPTLAPFAFIKFCLTRRDQCTDSNPVRSITLGEKGWEDLQLVNRQVNEAIAPDAAKGSLDWSLETRLGNCNDYAVQKRDALIRLGYPMGALSLAVVMTAFGEGHLVLTVRTDRGDFVLDNRRSTIMAWNRTGYRWIKRQSAEDPELWVALSNSPQGRPPASLASAKTAPAMRMNTPAGEAAAPTPEPVAQPALALAWTTRLAARLPGAASAEPSVGLTISHVAAGRGLGMLAFDDLGSQSPARAVAAAG